VSIWEPFSEGSRKALIRAQEVAQRWNTATIDVDHLASALAEGDDAVSQLLRKSLDTRPIQPADASVTAVQQDMVFPPAVKQTIELAFENARRLNHNNVGFAHLRLSSAHLALGILEPSDAPPLRAGADLAELRTALDAIAETGSVNPSG